MAIAVGQHAKASHASSAVTTGVATSGSGSSFVIGASYSSGSWTSFSDSKSNSYTQIGTERTIDSHSLRWYLCTNGTGGAGHTATVTAGAVTAFFVEITGGATVNLLDQNTGGSDATSTFGDSIQINTTQNSELILAMISSDVGAGSVNYTPGNSFTTVDAETDGNNFWTCNLSQRVVSSTGTYNLSATCDHTPTDALIVIASFKAAGSAGGVKRSLDAAATGGMQSQSGGMRAASPRSRSRIYVPSEYRSRGLVIPGRRGFPELRA